MNCSLWKNQKGLTELITVQWPMAIKPNSQDTGAPVGMWTWGHVHTKFWQNLVKNQNSFFFTKLILMETFWDLNCTHFQPFLKLRKTLRGKFSIWRYCWLPKLLITSNFVLQSSIRCCKSCEAYFGVSGFKSRLGSFDLQKLLFPFILHGNVSFLRKV